VQLLSNSTTARSKRVKKHTNVFLFPQINVTCIFILTKFQSMKSKMLLIILLLITGVVSCKKKIIEDAMSISDLFSYTGSGSVSCDERFPHENDTVTVFGWISEPRETEYANYFWLNDSETPPFKSIEVHVMENRDEIFRKINAKTHASGLTQIWIRGKIFPYKARYEDGSCRYFVSLHIYNESDIQF